MFKNECSHVGAKAALLGKIRGSKFESYSKTCLVSYVFWLKANASRVVAQKSVLSGQIFENWRHSLAMKVLL